MVLTKEKYVAFQHTVDQLLFMSERGRIDIQTYVAFLTTRVNIPDKDDWGKMKILLKCLKGKIHMKLMLPVYSMYMVIWWVVPSYNNHKYCKGHTKSMIYLRKGAVVSDSIKQKLNVRGSTESELVAAYDLVTILLWSEYFIKAQGYTLLGIFYITIISR